MDGGVHSTKPAAGAAGSHRGGGVPEGLLLLAREVGRRLM